MKYLFTISILAGCAILQAQICIGVIPSDANHVSSGTLVTVEDNSAYWLCNMAIINAVAGGDNKSIFRVLRRI